MLTGVSPILIAAAAALCMFSMFGAVAVGVVSLARPRMTVNRRLANMGLGPGKSERSSRQNLNPRQKRIQDRLQSLENRKRKEGASSKIRSQMLQAGLEPKLKLYFVASFFVGLVAMAIATVFGMSVPVAGSAAVFTAYFVPKWFLSHLYKRRQKSFTAEFANALDVIIRGVRSGLPVGECLQIIGRELPDPVGAEFRQLVEGQRIGLTLGELLQRGLQRMPTKEYKFFAIVLQIQQETGGNLADTLESLSGVLRDRKQMKDKAVALSSEAKSSAAIIGSLPFFVMGGITLVNGEYMSVLFNTSAGHWTMGGALAWMAAGILVMRNMIASVVSD